jgi:AcrR family transcriptional regulator
VRLTIGMAEAVAEKGYGGTTIADVVRHAKVSRRTFYEHFEDKEACFLAAYDGAAALILDTIARGAGSQLPWEERIMAGLDAYLDGMVQEPALTRVFLVEILGAGPRALARRREVHERFAAQQRALVDELRAERAEIAELSPAMSMAVVAAINELVLLAVEQTEEGGSVELLRETAAELLQAVVTRPRAA